MELNIRLPFSCISGISNIQEIKPPPGSGINDPARYSGGITPTGRGLMDGPGTYSQPPYAGGSKDESGTAAKDTISIGSGDRVSGADRMGMEVHYGVRIWQKTHGS